MEIRDLYSFKEIIKTGSFSKAAKQLGYTQSTISTHIQRLEMHYGEKLFDRIGRTIQLTTFGQDLNAEIDVLLSRFEAVESFHMKEEKIEGTIRIGAPDSLMMYKLYKIIYAYKQRYPLVNIIITGGLCPDLRKQVAAGTLDLCMMLQPLYEYEHLTVHALKRESFSLIFPPGHVEPYLPSSKQMVILAEEGCTYREVFISYLSSHGYHAANIIETGSVEAIKKYVIDGLGVSYVPNYAILEERTKKQVVAVDYESDLEFYTQLLYHKKKWQSPAIQYLIKMILSDDHD
ncbi:LysR family transcriptional regulator [Fusibacter paucivorans]|uniref:LysR family transcriptional regulator n=1 Tax=Fusibacter paucivorans TaxID=76009 RepID=A0ABS5PKA7_9FIRM|nr:LysR family transcriptional regulator [Fusibacter paucivorans]MBS7525312.1 LysR family transcriptional regulator [Fusibacter paucivorans]